MKQAQLTQVTRAEQLDHRWPDPPRCRLAWRLCVFDRSLRDEAESAASA